MMGGGETLAGVQDCSADRGHVQMARGQVSMIVSHTRSYP